MAGALILSHADNGIGADSESHRQNHERSLAAAVQALATSDPVATADHLLSHAWDVQGTADIEGDVVVPPFSHRQAVLELLAELNPWQRHLAPGAGGMGSAGRIALLSIQKDLIASQLKSTELKESLKSKQDIHTQESDKLRRVK